MSRKRVHALAAIAAAMYSLMTPSAAQVATPTRPAAVRSLPPLSTPAPQTAPLRPDSAPAETALPRGSQPGQDRDGDGVSVPQDCNDNDAGRFPGNTDVANDRDEDCDPQSIGSLDRDGDGFTDARVSNAVHYRSGPSGTDCDDTQAGINPNAQELPNRLDDNCDGVVDNLLGSWWTPR